MKRAEPGSLKVDFLSILNCDLTKKILADNYIREAISGWNDENLAMLFHMNGITEKMEYEPALKLLTVFAAFHKKDEVTLKKCLQEGGTTGVRLDYGLPLYSDSFKAGEDIFVAAVKIILGGDDKDDVDHKSIKMKHCIGSDVNKEYSEEECLGIANYVNNSFRIRKILQEAPNKKTIAPSPIAIEYIEANVATYKDSNKNPVTVFIPGLIDTAKSTSELIISSAKKCNINGTGFFGHPGIVWSVILGDVEAVKTALNQGASVELPNGDEFGNRTLTIWATATLAAICASGGEKLYENRMVEIINELRKHDKFLSTPNLSGRTAVDYLPEQYKNLLSPPCLVQVNDIISPNKQLSLN